MTEFRIAACFAGGGAYGYGYHMGIVDGLRQRGLDLTGAALSGTSAGAFAAATLVTGLSFDQVASAWQTYLDDTGTGYWVRGIELTRRIYELAASESTGQSTEQQTGEFDAIAVRLWRWRRTALSSKYHPIPTIVAASGAVMPVARPVKIDGKRYVDGGHISNSSIDLAPAADLLLFFNPFKRDGMGFAGRWLSRNVEREAAQWTARTGGDVLMIEPTATIAKLFRPQLEHIASIEIGRAVYSHAVEYGHTVAAELQRLYPQLISYSSSE